MIQNYNNFKNNQMGNKINEGVDAANVISAFYDNQIKQLQALKRDSLKDFNYLANELETLFGLSVQVDMQQKFRIIGNLKGMSIVTVTEIYQIFSKTEFVFLGVGMSDSGKRQQQLIIYSANDLLKNFDYILITDVMKSAE
jgi:hypothetical protein